MTPKEKADDIYDKMVVDFDMDNWQSRLCALLAVDEILNNCHYSNIDYWKQVKSELEKI